MYQISLDESKRLLDDFKAKEDAQIANIELAVHTFERCSLQLKDPQMRSGLAALEGPILG